MCENIGKNIVKYRKLNGMSRNHLADRIGISQQGLFKIEKGMVNPRANTIEKIITALCITPNQLFGTEQITEDNNSIIAKLREGKEVDNG